MSPPSIAVIVVLGVLGVIWVVRTDRRRTAEKAALLTTLGFQRLESPDPQQAEPLLALFRRGRGGTRLELWRTFHRASASGHLYAFSVLNRASSRQSLVASDAVGRRRLRAAAEAARGDPRLDRGEHPPPAGGGRAPAGEGAGARTGLLSGRRAGLALSLGSASNSPLAPAAARRYYGLTALGSSGASTSAPRTVARPSRARPPRRDARQPR